MINSISHDVIVALVVATFLYCVKTVYLDNKPQFDQIPFKTNDFVMDLGVKNIMLVTLKIYTTSLYIVVFILNLSFFLIKGFSLNNVIISGFVSTLLIVIIYSINYFCKKDVDKTFFPLRV